jgi:hypothetical protein
MRVRRLLHALLLAAALCGLFVAPAQAWTVTGGTAEQRADVAVVLESITFPSVEWVEAQVGPVHVGILDHYSPWWELDPAALVDEFPAGAAGVAGPGYIYICASYQPGPSTFFREIVAHEWAHQVWFGLVWLGNGATTEWKHRVVEGFSPPPNPADWYQNYVESHAEQLRVAMFPPTMYLSQSPRTELNILGNEAVLAFHHKYIDGPPPTTTTTLPPSPPTTAPPATTTTTTYTPPPRGDPFPDVTSVDAELWAAAWWAKDTGIFLGYPNGHLEPGLSVTYRALALTVARAMGQQHPEWEDDYRVVPRGVVWDTVPSFTWDSDRWGEPLTRGQLLRLFYRDRR